MIDEIPSAVADALWPFAAAFLVAGYIGFVAYLSVGARHV